MAVATLSTRRMRTISPPATLVLDERRRGGRSIVKPAYTCAAVRVLGQRRGPMDGHVHDLATGGVAVELDDLLPPGTPVTLEFQVAGLGRLKNGQWPTFAATAEVVRNEDVDEFPAGPYLTVLRFVKISTMSQAQIARFVAAHSAEHA